MKMKSKKIGVFVISLCLVILALGIISAESCDIRLKTECQTTPWNNTVMRLSGLTNAHGELWSQNNYDYVLCCNFVRTHDCGTNKILGLSDVTNAHAEVPENSEYATPVCYGDFICRSGAITCDSDEMGILSLTDSTNAHIGRFEDYGTKICCSGICGTGAEYIGGNCVQVTEIYWALPEKPDEGIYDIQVEVGETTVLMMVKNSGLPNGTKIDFEIHEYDGLLSGDVRTIEGVVDSDGHANVIWTISSADIEQAFSSFLEGDELEYFYFEVADMPRSTELIITIIECQLIHSCGNYDTNDSCEGDACGVASIGLEGIDCDDPLIECGCQWDDEENECKPFYEIVGEVYCGHCGDSYVMLPWEECDDGNHDIKDGCSPNCKIEGGWECTGDPSDGEPSICTLVGEQEWCGDKIINNWEECDDENNINGDGCSAYCMTEDEGKWCGDSTQNQDWEECDEGNDGWNEDDCSADCQNNSNVSCEEVDFLSGFGRCIITQTTDDNCDDDDFITYTWEGEWVGDPDPGNPFYVTCIAGGTRPVPCPAQIALPFFGVYNLIVACIVVALVYVFLTIKKKKSKKA